MDERDGQHMGVVEKALEKCVPPFSMTCRVLFMACIEPGRRKEREKKIKGERGYKKGEEGERPRSEVKGTQGDIKQLEKIKRETESEKYKYKSHGVNSIFLK